MDPKPPSLSVRTTATALGYIRRIDRMAQALLRSKFSDALDIWRFQEDLLTLQRKIQESISVIKKKARKDRSLYPELEALRGARWHARRLGDAFAWVLLGLDRGLIHPLAANRRVPLAQENHGSTGVMAISAHLSGEGWGFPLIHDVTDCLRIGDISFIKPKGRTREIHTVEVKTRFMGESPEGSGDFNQYQVSVISPRPHPSVDAEDVTANIDVEDGPPSSTGSSSPPKNIDRRINRQSARMNAAFLRQQAGAGSITTVDGKPMITVEVNHQHSANWKDLRRIIRESRQSGFASCLVDGALLYAAFYDAQGVTTETVRTPRLIADIKGYSFSNPTDTVVMHGIPCQEKDNANMFLPFYLYQIPKRAISDLIYGRLLILVMVNISRLTTKVEEAGFSVYRDESIVSHPYNSLTIATEIEDGQKGRLLMQIKNPAHFIHEMVQEFKSMSQLIEIIGHPDMPKLSLENRRRRSDST